MALSGIARSVLDYSVIANVYFAKSLLWISGMTHPIFYQNYPRIGPEENVEAGNLTANAVTQSQ